MSVFSRFSYISRKRKLELFNQLMKPTENTTVLDVGAQAEPYNNKEVQFIDRYPWKKNVSAVNISMEHIELILKHYPEINAVVADACEIPWPDKHFDIVFSNAVIEHVGDFEKQKKMASEIMRVGKRWFVTTPNRWYPFEFHYRLPFVTWLPFNGYLLIRNMVSYSHIKNKYVFGCKRTENLRLLSKRELQECFPRSEIVKQRVTFMSEVLIAIGGDDWR